LITAITDDSEIKQGLFPAPGANVSTSQGGGKPKADHYWALCIALFSEHEDYRDHFARVNRGSTTSTKDRTLWGDKIKNRLRKMATQVREIRDQMGETGEGIQHKEDLWEGSELCNKWQLHESECPWYWDMKALIGQL
ncbi:hypothetical protein NEOLEDRAFT_1073284, partial [Neolentinus lepideus HHB14362 ss-1]